MASTGVVNLTMHHARKGILSTTSRQSRVAGVSKKTRMYASGTLVSLRAKLLFGYPFFIALFFANALMLTLGIGKH